MTMTPKSLLEIVPASRDKKYRRTFFKKIIVIKEKTSSTENNTMSDEGEYIRTPRYDPRLVLKHATASLANGCGLL